MDTDNTAKLLQAMMDDIPEKMSQVSLSNQEVSNVRPAVPPSEDPDVDQLLTSCLHPLRVEYMSKLQKPLSDGDLEDRASFQIPKKLSQNLYAFIWGPDVFKSPRPLLKRIYNDISAKLAVTPEQSDLDDMLQYHPMEVVSSKFIQLVLAIAMVEPELAEADLKYLEDLLNDERVKIDSVSLDAYEHLLRTVKQLYLLLTGGEYKPVTNDAPLNGNDNGLAKGRKSIINALSSLYMKGFRVKQNERFQKLKNAMQDQPGNIELTLYAAEMLRLRRREQGNFKNKRPGFEEMCLVEETLKMERNNPFVILNLIDCIVDSLRESNGRFHCGEIIHLHDTEQAMKFFQDECNKLCQDFPKNVHILSIVADYFARYVPMLYFDKALSLKLLLTAHQLNPENAKTTHRLGILYRMNFRNIPESLKWLEKTLELDPSHFNASMDYSKTMLGKPDVYKDVGKRMEERLRSTVSSTWRMFEKTEFQFYVGLAYFASGDKEETLRNWIEVMKVDELDFNLSAVDSSQGFYCWSSKHISTDMIRGWIHDEMEKTRKIRLAGGDYDVVRLKKIERMFHLMLCIVPPKREEAIPPYTENFQCALLA